ncbi:MAG TPA: hypothetical protein VGH64_12955 [Puia sp.]
MGEWASVAHWCPSDYCGGGLLLLRGDIYISSINSIGGSKMTFETSLDKLKLAGFSINPKIQEADVFNGWKKTLVYHPNPIDALYITLGDETSYKPYLNFSNDCWHFDLEAIEGEGSYGRILENLNRISNGELNFQNVKDL